MLSYSILSPQIPSAGSWRLLTKFAEIKWNKIAFNSLLKRFGKQKAPTEGTGVADRSSVRDH